MCRSVKFLSQLAALLCLSTAAKADLVFSVTGSVDANPAIADEPIACQQCVSQGPLVQFVAGTWSQTVALTDASIDAGIDGTGTLVAYLTDQIGPGTTIADQIATSTFTVNNAPQSNEATVFTGLTLPAGTYYLVIAQSSANTGDIAAWAATANPVVTGSPLFDVFPATSGGGIENAFLPGSAFEESTVNSKATYGFMEVSGVAVPEPAEPIPLLVGSAFLGWMVLGRRRTSSLGRSDCERLHTGAARIIQNR